MRDLSRRSILGGAAALPFIAAACGAAAPVAAADRAAWDQAKAAYDAAYNAHHTAAEAWNAIEEAVELPKHPYRDVTFTLAGNPHTVAYLPEKEQFVLTAEHRERLRRRAKAWERLKNRVDVASGEQAARERCWALVQPMHTARAALMATPAPDTAALAYKMEVIDRHTCSEGPDEEDWQIIRADFARLTGTAVQHG